MAYSIGKSKRCNISNWFILHPDSEMHNRTFVNSGPGSYESPLVHKKKEPQWT